MAFMSYCCTFHYSVQHKLEKCGREQRNW